MKKPVITGYYIFFRSTAYSYDELLTAWQSFVIRQGKAIEVSGRKVLLGDHTAAVKDGRKMPGVVSLRESSETQSKPDYFRGQCWGAIGLLTGTLLECFCCPLQLQIHQGWKHLGITEEEQKKCQAKLGERLVLMAIAFASTQGCPCYLVLDAFFSSGNVFRVCQYYSIELKTVLVHVLVKAKGNFVAYFPPDPKPASKRGRQAFYGEKIYLKECFDYLHLFETVTCQVYGKKEEIQVMTLKLLWKPIADYVLFIFAITSKGPIILMSSDFSLTGTQAIELYCSRTRIEILFWVLKHIVNAFNFRFWTKSMPKHSRRPFSNKELKAPKKEQLNNVKACWRAYETFVLCAAIATGLLQWISLHFHDEVWSKQHLYLRTQSRELPSEKTVKQILAPLLLKQFFLVGKNSMIAQIRAYFMAVSDELDA